MKVSANMINNSGSIAESLAKRPDVQFGVLAGNAIAANAVLAPVSGGALLNFVGKWGSTSVGIAQGGTDLVLSTIGKKTTTQLEAEILIRGSIIQQQTESYRYFAIMGTYDNIANWWDMNTVIRPNGPIQEPLPGMSMNRWH